MTLSSKRINTGKNRFQQSLIPTFSILAAVSTVMVGISAKNTWSVYQNFQSAITKNFKLQDLSGQIVHLDEVLTMSARMAASTGNLAWEERYLEHVPPLDEAINQVLSIAPEQQANASQTDEANIKLIEMEERAFELVRQGNSAEALSLLLGEEYSIQKQIYSEGVEATLENIQQSVAEQIETYGDRLSRSAILAGVSFAILVVSWVLVLILLRSYTLRLNQIQQSLEQANLDLEGRIKERTKELAAKELESRQESEVLQQDVGQLLDVVSAIEEGDFTVEAPVSDRVTGLVSDTLNRLIEELAGVLAQVFRATDRVNRETQQLDTVTNQVAGYAQKEAQSVRQILELTDKVMKSALDSAEQTQASIASLQNLQSAVEQGRDSSLTLNKGIGVLQQGTDQIVQQMKTLGEFVGLTDQFLQEQNQISGMTQVLAMNASLVAARASEQKDPTQFVVVAREFESIANQVSSLAQRTSGGLVSLEQRSSQIHNVVTSIDANVQNLGGLVREFTQGVEQSSQIFENVQDTTQEAVRTGQVVALSSQEIINSAQSTTKVMEEIADLAEKTEELTQKTLAQSQQMETLSQDLLSTIRFFRLPSSGQETATVDVIPNSSEIVRDNNSAKLESV
ncbi:methyl-accepting chemotaxis protein [Pleurocapsales cyanobacterium LEGE 10410]|nr:methyl-accepting chemotaxis protein [Pleurocapsales cyanobacterium LEGE 10410]